jgi:pSer/pThr/pTyr-binding forkhead associated (FHA) protein
VIKGSDQGKQFELDDQVVSIGRDSTSRIRLHDTEISRRHAELRRTDDGFLIADVGSVNGTFVNDVQITESALQPGDRVQVGRVFSSTAPASAAAVAVIWPTAST